MVQTTASPRERLLDAALAHVERHGIGDLSLRRLAAALGTTHRMLIYHFGSREQLLIEVVRTFEARERAAVLDADPAGPELSLADAIRRNWERVADTSMWARERLFFELYAQALQGHGHAAEFLDGVVDSWLEPLTGLFEAVGFSAATARAEARLALATVRGLLLDLLATGDRAGADAAIERYIAHLGASG